MTEKQHFYHSRWCEKCQRQTVHDAGNCTVCADGEAMARKSERPVQEPKAEPQQE